MIVEIDEHDHAINENYVPYSYCIKYCIDYQFIFFTNVPHSMIIDDCYVVYSPF